MPLDVGAVAPDFTLPAHTGDNVTLSQYKGEKNVVLSFHVYTFTGG
jgi:peroxiredoxin (alkyl hydroperoxide reductase subunit C)